MPNIKSAKKRVKVIAKKTMENQMIKSQLKTVIKKFEAAVAEGDKANAAEQYKVVVKKLDQACAKGTFHKNTIARRKSRMTKLFNKMA
ncbi:MAG: 30S ribosomal protein S20 [Eubacteriales bacterium]|nr:30S ribosomal protein S20 [Eubacteriales bacterium]